MNILFDFISLQDSFINGGAEYTFVILKELLKQIDIKIFALVTKNKEIPERTKKIINENKIEIIDIDLDLNLQITNNNIDLLFIGIAQRYNMYDLTKINCEIYIVCHDIGDISQIYDNNFYSKKRNAFVKNYCHADNSIKSKIRYFYNRYCRKNSIINGYHNFAKLIQRKNVTIITDSNYSKYAIEYFFDKLANEINVFYAPMKKVKITRDRSCNETLNYLIDSKKKYFLLVNCNRQNKNAAIFVEQWNKFCGVTNNQYYAILLGKCSYKNENLFVIDKLDDNDLQLAYKNAYALVYPSVTEGFGYPPIEAMTYGTPVICSNVTSIPEVVGNKNLLFSPYYPEDLFRCLVTLTLKHEEYAAAAKQQYSLVSEKQEKDFSSLISFITKR